MRIIFLMLFFSSLGFSQTTHYILDGGSGDGSAWNNALDDIPSTLVRGDPYCVGDGVYGGEIFDDLEDGTEVITIVKAVDGDGTCDQGTGWSSTMGDGQATFTGTFEFCRGFYTIDGVIRNEADWTDQVYGFRLTGGSATFGQVISNASNCGSGVAGDSITLQYIDLGGAHSATFSETHPGAGIYVVGGGGRANDWTIRRNYIHNADLAMLLNNHTGFLIEENWMEYTWQKDAHTSYLCRWWTSSTRI